MGLEPTVTELGRCVDQCQCNLFSGNALGLWDEGFTQIQNALADTNARALEHNKVLLDHSVMREATHGIDGLLSDVLLGGGIVLNDLAILGVEAFSDAIDLFVNLRSVMVAFLADASDRESNTRRMPSTNTGNLAKTLVSLTRQLFDVPTSDNTFDSVTLGDADDVNHLILAENILDRNRLLQQPASKVDLLWDGTAVELDFVDVGLLLSFLKKLDLSVGDDADDGAVFLHLGKILFLRSLI